MIKLTNLQASSFMSPAINSLVNDTQRLFPTEDAFKLADVINTIRERLKPYFLQQKSIIERNNGTISDDGKVSFTSIEDRELSEKETIELNEVELEYPIEKISIKSTWPMLTLTEASILKPILDM